MFIEMSVPIVAMPACQIELHKVCLDVSMHKQVRCQMCLWLSMFQIIINPQYQTSANTDIL